MYSLFFESCQRLVQATAGFYILLLMAESNYNNNNNEEEDGSDELQQLVEPTPQLLIKFEECHNKHGSIRLNLSSLKLTYLPFEVKGFTDLKVLNLRNNKLTIFPSELCAALYELEELNLSQNEITYIPENISSLSNLRKLSLSKNKIVELPMGIYNCPALQELRADYNLLTNISGHIGDLTLLHTLVLSNNHIRIIPNRAVVSKMNLIF